MKGRAPMPHGLYSWASLARQRFAFGAAGALRGSASSHLLAGLTLGPLNCPSTNLLTRSIRVRHVAEIALFFALGCLSFQAGSVAC